MPTASVLPIELDETACAAPVVVRPSPAHGLGVFATRPLAAGTRVAEYTGDRISHAEAAARYDDASSADVHTVLFTLDRRTVIDGATGDGVAHYLNHSCDPNCEAFLEDGRIYLETIRAVEGGTELTFDYRLRRPQPLPRDWRRRYACRCAASTCRGTMLVRPPRRRAPLRRARRPVR